MQAATYGGAGTSAPLMRGGLLLTFSIAAILPMGDLGALFELVLGEKGDDEQRPGRRGRV